jgi:hypothetical protein
MTWIALFRPYKYPFRNLLAVINEIGLIFLFVSASVWIGNDLTCDAKWTQFCKAHNNNSNL